MASGCTGCSRMRARPARSCGGKAKQAQEPTCTRRGRGAGDRDEGGSSSGCTYSSSRVRQRSSTRAALQPLPAQRFRQVRELGRALATSEASATSAPTYVCQSLMKRGKGGLPPRRFNAKRFEETILGQLREGDEVGPRLSVPRAFLANSGSESLPLPRTLPRKPAGGYLTVERIRSGPMDSVFNSTRPT